MPFYELTLVLRTMPKNDTVACLKRVANLIWNEDGVIKKIDYLGHKQLPFEINRPDQGEKYTHASYFMFHTSLFPAKLPQLRPEFKLDMDLLRFHYALKDQSKLPSDFSCTLEEELLPPVYRKSVQPLLDDKNVRAETRR